MPPQELNVKLESFSRTVSDEAKALRTLINGNKLSLSLLNTQEKANLVAALNEVLLKADSPASLEDIDIVVNDYFVLHPQTYTHDQVQPAMIWLVTHPLDHNPAVTITDSAGTIWTGEVTYPSPNVVRIAFNLALSGKAVLT